MFKENATILFQGDSITDAGRERTDMSCMGKGYPLLISSQLNFEYPKKNYTFINKGVSGNKIVDLYARWREEAINLQPDYISILIGVNDVWSEFTRQNGVNAKKFERLYDILLQDTLEYIPDVKIILCEPFLLDSHDATQNFSEFYNELQIRQEIVRKLANKYNATFVALQSAFNEKLSVAAASHWAIDGIHPTPAGHKVIAQSILKSLL